MGSATDRSAVSDSGAVPGTEAVTGAIADLEETARPAPPAARPGDRMPADRAPRSGPVRRPYPGGASPGPGGNGGGNGGDDRETERGLRGLVGSGSSQVSVGAALRARDAARPSDEQLADADRNLTIVRRNWVPREELPRNR
ncbi:hypothetical protein ACQPZX_07360 [Actinoplanes sp. CA-142083]|uniref:hypothetical protein n=1 Tax=Actinoplanes sp. CA-142083 TaxID=3239903 RepID=UPI003D91252F